MPQAVPGCICKVVQTRSFQYYVQNCALYDFIGLIHQYIQYVQNIKKLAHYLHTGFATLFAHRFCTSVSYISFAQLFAQLFCIFIFTYVFCSNLI